MTDFANTILHMDITTYKNDNRYTGSFNITGVTAQGVNQVVFTSTLDKIPDICDIEFYGPSNALDTRPTNTWFREGYIWVFGNNIPAGYTNQPLAWSANAKIVGNVVTITMTYVQTFPDALTLTSTPMQFRLIDYSVILN